MKQQIICLMLLLFTLPAAAHEEFWWHAYAYDADRIDMLDIERVDSLIRVIPKDEEWMSAVVDQVHWYFAHELPQIAARAVNKGMRLLSEGRVDTDRPAYWYYGLLNLYAEKITNQLAFSNAFGQIRISKSIPVPEDKCLPCMAVEFNYLKLMAKSGRFLTDTQYESIVDLFNAAYQHNYTEITGYLAGYLIHASAYKKSHRIDDMVVPISQLVAELPPRPKARILIDLAPVTEDVGVDSVQQFWRSFIDLGSSKNLFALFRGHLELGIIFEEIGQFDSAWYYYNLAHMYATKSQDFEAEVHSLSTLSRLAQRDAGIALPDSLSARLAYLSGLQNQSASDLKVIMNDILITDLDTSNRRLARLNQIILFLLIGVGILLLGSSWLLWRLFQQRKALQQANADKTMLYGMIAHDLRAPLSGFKTVLHKDLPPVEKEKQLDRVVNRLQWLLDDLLKWTFSQQKQLQVQMETIDLVELLEENLGYFQDIIDSRGLQLSVKLPDELPVEADQEMISTVLRNLLQNAIKHNKNGGKVSIEANENDGGIVVSIINDTSEMHIQNRASLGKQLIETFSRINQVKIEEEGDRNHHRVTLSFYGGYS